MLVLSHGDREILLGCISAMTGVARKISRDSRHQQRVAWRGRPYTVSWQLHFDADLAKFVPVVKVLGSSGSSEVALVSAIQARLGKLRESEDWPVELPDAWLRGEK